MGEWMDEWMDGSIQWTPHQDYRDRFLCCPHGNPLQSGKGRPVTAATHGVYERKTQMKSTLLLKSPPPSQWTSLQTRGAPSRSKCTVSFFALLPTAWLLPHPAPSSLPAPSACLLKGPGNSLHALLGVCVDITSRLFGCVCQSVMTELNTGIYSAITTVSGQALCRNWVCGTDRVCVCWGLMHRIYNLWVGVHIHVMIVALVIAFCILSFLALCFAE